MKQYFKTSAVFALTQMKRSFRDPMTLLVLFAIPLLLLLIFGAFFKNTNNITLKVIVINNSSEQYAKDFSQTLKGMKVLRQPDESISVDEAKQRMSDGELDGIIELPTGFGALNASGVPTGAVSVYYDGTNPQTGDIVSSVMRGVIDDANRRITTVSQPLTIERKPINITQVKAIDNIFPMFTGLAIMMVGIFGVASVIPYDKKGGYLRRLRATPMRPGQFMLGTMINHAVIGFAIVTLMTILALTLFDLNMRGSWLAYSSFAALALISMIGFGLAIGGIAKNTTQSDVLGQVVFLASMALGGIWFPRALMPEFMQNLVAFMPLTPIIDGIRAIVVENTSLLSLGSEFAVLGGWALVTYIVGIKLFSWE